MGWYTFFWCVLGHFWDWINLYPPGVTAGPHRNWCSTLAWRAKSAQPRPHFSSYVYIAALVTIISFRDTLLVNFVNPGAEKCRKEEIFKWICNCSLTLKKKSGRFESEMTESCQSYGRGSQVCMPKLVAKMYWGCSVQNLDGVKCKLANNFEANRQTNKRKNVKVGVRCRFGVGAWSGCFVPVSCLLWNISDFPSLHY